MSLIQWAIKWGIPFAAVEDLRREFGLINTDPKLKHGESEAAVSTRVCLEASRKGMRLLRNNSGAAYDKTGRVVRFGWGNESKNSVKHMKSPDLIGVKPVLIEAHHMGQTLGVLLLREIKESKWVFSATEEEVAQLRCLELFASFGADAAFAVGEGTL